MALCARPFPDFFNTESEVKELALKIILLASCYVPFQGICHSSYFALRSGGKTWLTFLFDSGLQWVLYIPLAYFLSHFTDLDVIRIFVLVNCSDIVKCGLSLLFLRKINWAQNIVSTTDA